jgi:hypothetical protein
VEVGAEVIFGEGRAGHATAVAVLHVATCWLCVCRLSWAG